MFLAVVLYRPKYELLFSSLIAAIPPPLCILWADFAICNNQGKLSFLGDKGEGSERKWKSAIVCFEERSGRGLGWQAPAVLNFRHLGKQKIIFPFL